MQLKQLIAQLDTLKAEGSLEREIAGLAYDSRRITPGMVFVALPGQHVDGHEFIQSAVDRGAVAVICEKNGFVQQRAAKIKVADARLALAQAAIAYHQNPAAQLKMIAVTGTNGKTTVAFLIKQLLEANGLKTGLLGTIRYEIGERVIPAHRTTPESLELQQMLAQMVRANCRACVMEVSSHALEQKRVYGIGFDVMVFTNLTQDHLDYHGTMEAYFEAKRRLFVGWPRQGKRPTAVINLDDSFGQRLAQETDAPQTLTYGIAHAAQVRAAAIQLGSETTRLTISTPNQSFAAELPLIGRHNVYNALAAIGAGLAMQQEPSAMQKSLRSAPPVPGRLEKISLGQPFAVLVDYAHTDDALQNVLRTLREVTAQRLLVAFGCGGNRDRGKRPKMGQVAARLADCTLITSDNPRKESAADIASQIERGFLEVRRDGYRIELDRGRAIEELIRAAKPGDTVLIAGKGHETYQEFEDTVVPFDDRVHARETLFMLGYRAHA